jgi:neuronal guanine nucleotide exchange factor
MLPMQRATRYRLLLFAILDYAPANTAQVFTASRALNLANMLVQQCNEGARLLERTEQLLEIERRLVYKSADLKRIPLVQKTRHVVKSGLLTQFIEQRYRPKLNMLQTKQKSRQLYVFLFNDLILIASKKA